MEADNNLANVSMEIILNAGNARQKMYEAHNFLLKGEIKDFEDKMVQAKDNITLAHNSQTETIQSQIAEDIVNINLLFIHAQDTLMTIMSEYNMLTMIGKSHQALLIEIEKLKD